MMDLRPLALIQDLMEMEIFAGVNQAIEPEIATKVCEKHGFIFEKEKREKGAGVHKVEEVIEVPAAPALEEVEEDQLQLRPPVVTFMGHVDHGKTSLLDAFRGSRVVAGEAGGITQHIGAYQVTRNGHSVTFIDTPGHAAFSEMRARGANVTDIVVLVVAADDGLMPTTFEAIDHCKAAGVTIIVAINKCDLPRADLHKTKGQLQEVGLTPEDYGGTTICVEVSAKTGQGLDTLFDMIHLQAEVLELKANPAGPARGTVIEARTEAGKGPTATVLIQSGTLDMGDSFICGVVWGKVKALLDDRQKRIQSAGPSTPVEIVGYSGVPNVGDELVELENERKAKKLSDERLEQQRQAKLAPIQRSALETLFNNIEQGKKASLRLIIKADAQGSLQAIEKSLNEIESDKISAEILRQSVGPITEADVILASASDAILIGFNTKVEAKAQPVVKREGVQVKLFSIIYELIDQVKEAMLGMLAPETREKVVGHAKILQVFRLSSGKVGGCTVTDGRIVRRARARVLRDGVPIYDGGFSTLRRFKEDVKEVKVGLECGIKLGRFNDYLEGDIIECYELEKLEQTL
jgi:translation initiation factor IF-2